MHEVAVAGMQFDQVIADAFGTADRGDVVRLELRNVVQRHRPRHMPALIIGERRRRHRLPGALLLRQRLATERRWQGRSLAAGMAKLDAMLGNAILPAEIDDPLQRPLIVIGAERCAFQRDPAHHVDIGRLGHHQPAGAAQRELAKLQYVPVGGRALDRIVLAHRRHDDAVRQGKRSERDRRKQSTLIPDFPPCAARMPDHAKAERARHAQ